MSSPKQVLNSRVKISKTGRPYVDVADLVKSELDRIRNSQADSSRNGAAQPSRATETNGNGSDSDPHPPKENQQ
jgi:hypothetical protein